MGVTTTAEGLARVRELGAADSWLALLVTRRGRTAGADPSVSLVNAGVLPHPRTGEPVVAFVARGATAKLANLRARPCATLVFRAGWEWIAVRGPVELAGPDDPLPGVTAPDDRLRVLLRDVFAAAGGTHPDLAEYDRAMADDRRTAVLLTPERFTTNPPGTEHVEPAPGTGTAPPPVAPGTIQLWTDLLCPFAHVAVHRIRQARERLGLDVRLDHHAFPLELFNGPHPRRGTDTEAVGLGQIAPEAGFRVWTAADDLYPHTVLLAAEAVLAAKAQSLAAGEALDVALRRAFWSESRSIGHRQVVLDVAGQAGLDVDALAEALDSGRHRRDLMTDFAVARTDAIAGSPTLRLADGTTITNPGVTVRWEGPWAAGYPIVEADDPSVYDDLLRRAAATAP